MINSREYFASENFHASLLDLSKKAGLPTEFGLKPLKGGRNNRVFCFDYENGAKALLKAYFQHSMDTRDRLKAEYSFIRFAWDKVKCVPKTIAADFQNKLGLYEFIDGRRLSQTDINENKIKEALDFFIKINKHKNTEEAKNLQIASEACFSIKEHMDTVNKRIEKLKKIKGESEADKKAMFFINNELSEKWNKTLKHIYNCIDKFKLNSNEKISNNETCISPSDFGFHNAILNKNNKLIFIDFEYAGWDDPAKMVCDFFCQPEVQVPLKYFNLFVKIVGNNTPNPEKLKHRILTLLPLYKIKWCCILLNEFLDVSSERRNFAYGKTDFDMIKLEQLRKAKKYLESDKFIK